MTTLASRSGRPTPTYITNMPTNQPHYRVAAPSTTLNGHGVFTSPTESEFSESYQDARDSVQDWDENKVAEWLRSINCGQYVDIFRRNNINGENLMDMDQATLKEMGIKKIGDRVRIGSQAKLFRKLVYNRTSKRVMNRNSLATLDNNASQLTPPSSASPRQASSARSPNTSRIEKPTTGRSISRPGSPLVDQENRSGTRSGPQRSNLPSPRDILMPPSQTSRYGSSSRGTTLETPQTARFTGHLKASPSIDNLSSTVIVGALPNDKPVIRVIYENGWASVINIDGFRTAEDIVRATLRKGTLNENHFRSYCFYVLDGTDPNPTFCRRLGEAELCKLCHDRVRSERGRLILRKIHTAEPEGEQLRAAARIAEQQLPEPPAIEVQATNKSRSHLKIEKLTGEPLAAVTYPMSPASQAERREYFNNAAASDAGAISRQPSYGSSASARAQKLKDFYGARPPTELITQDLQSYFPEVAKEEMDRTVRMSIRRSQRMSRAMSRLSTVSNFSIASSLKDAPPIPTIADHWMKDVAGNGSTSSIRGSTLRPLSVARLGRPDSYRESIASSNGLQQVDEEESPIEPDRKSYVSLSGAESGSDTATDTHTSAPDPNAHSVSSYYDDTGSSPIGTEITSGSLNSRLSQFIAEDGEEEDDELMQHLENDSWDDIKYMKGAMIGQGSFGTVFLALHAVTAELMAVKQVELPTTTGTAADAKKKNNMIDALKHEISLLRDLKHPNIVQYLGSNSEEKTLNIFLEYVAGGSVATMLVNYGSLPEGLISNFVRQILEGLSYLHSEDIIHRDIKGANILVDNKGTVKISDFGISKRVEASTLLQSQGSGPGLKRGGPRVSLQGSVFWMAPEVVRQTAYTKKADIWSLGCLVVEMFTGSHPHPNCTQLQAIFKIGGSGTNADNAKPDIPEQTTPDARAFLSSTFEIEHEKRPSARELMGYAFCNQGKP